MIDVRSSIAPCPQSPPRLEPPGKQILDELAELPSTAFLHQGDLGALVSVLANSPGR